MNPKFASLKYVPGILALLSVLVVFQPISTASAAIGSPDIIVTVSDLERNLKLLDEVAGPDGASVSNQLKAFLQSTDWIDPSRSAVIGIEIKDPQPSIVSLVPFRRPNEAFQSSTSAALEKDCYLVAFPPGQQADVSDAFKSALNAASRLKPKSFVTIEVGLKRLMDKNEPQIRQMLSQLGQMSQAEGTADMPISPLEIQEMMMRMLDKAAQLETLKLSLDLTH